MNKKIEKKMKTCSLDNVIKTLYGQCVHTNSISLFATNMHNINDHNCIKFMKRNTLHTLVNFPFHSLS